MLCYICQRLIAIIIISRKCVESVVRYRTCGFVCGNYLGRQLRRVLQLGMCLSAMTVHYRQQKLFSSLLLRKKFNFSVNKISN